MINKKQFVKIINHLKEVNDFLNETNDKARELNDAIISDFFNASSLSISFENDLVRVLENMFETDLISWWLYELEYGKNFTIGCIIEADGITKPDLSTPEKLYDYLIKSKEDKQ
jgi:hypothetical protein